MPPPKVTPQASEKSEVTCECDWVGDGPFLTEPPNCQNCPQNNGCNKVEFKDKSIIYNCWRSCGFMCLYTYIYMINHDYVECRIDVDNIYPDAPSR